jgi:hypothetical protein
MPLFLLALDLDTPPTEKGTPILATITPEIRSKLEKIGFDEDEINTIQIVYELKTRNYPIDIIKLINQAAFEKLSKGIAEAFEKNNWSEEDFFEIVEKHRAEKKNETGFRLRGVQT